MGKPLNPWVQINKGDRRPNDRVIVSYEYYDTAAAILGQEPWRWGVIGAYWNPKRSQWIGDHGKPVPRVTHWMPMPKIEEGSDA